MGAKHFIALADAFRYSRPYVPDTQDLDYKVRVSMYRQWLHDIDTVATQLGKLAPHTFNPILWVDYIHGYAGKRGGKLVPGKEVTTGG